MNWDDLSPNLQTAIVRTMLLHLPAMSCRETIVSVWSLGKLGVSFKELNKITATEAATTGTSAEGDAISSSTALTGGITDTNIYIGSDANTDTNTATSDLRAGMLSKLEVVAPQMTVFDSESLLLALGLMEVNKRYKIKNTSLLL